MVEGLEHDKIKVKDSSMKYMQILKHSHEFIAPLLGDVWKEVHQQIFKDGNMFADIFCTCKCGTSKIKKFHVGIATDDLS